MLEGTTNTYLPAAAPRLPASPSRRSQREMARAAEQTILGITNVEGALMLTAIGLQGADLIAGQLIMMHEKHGDLALHVAAPIVDAYGARVSAIIRGAA